MNSTVNILVVYIFVSNFSNIISKTLRLNTSVNSGVVIFEYDGSDEWVDVE